MTARYTAAEVRNVTFGVGHENAMLRGMLEDYAARLEQEDMSANLLAGVIAWCRLPTHPSHADATSIELTKQTVEAMATGRMASPLFDRQRVSIGRLEEAREQGRQEVLREIERIDPWAYAPGVDECKFCEGQGMHNADCLWQRAQQARAQEAGND